MGFLLRSRAAAAGGRDVTAGEGEDTAKPWLAAALCMLLASSAGGVVLVWWAIVFHPHNEQLWMVPVGLVLFWTPIIVWLSIFGSEIWRKIDASVLKSGGCSDLPVVAPAAPAPSGGPFPTLLSGK